MLYEVITEKYGIPWMEYNFFGPTKTSESLRKIAAHFDESIQKKAEEVIAKYEAQTAAIIAKYKPRLEGKKVMLYVGGLRPRHVIGAYEDLGMEIVGTGYEFVITSYSIHYTKLYEEGRGYHRGDRHQRLSAHRAAGLR